MAATALYLPSKQPPNLPSDGISKKRGPTHICTECPHRAANRFCNNFAQLQEQHGDIGSVAFYRKHMRLFDEGAKARGVFVLCSGRAKLCTSSRLGKNIIARIAQPGDLLGLGAVVSSRPYEATAELMTSAQVKFIARNSFFQLMQEHQELRWAVAEQLSNSYYAAFDTVRALGLTTHPVERLAKLLLSWFGLAEQQDDFHAAIRVTVPLSHQDIADSIGSTRETVSRLFCELRKKRLVQSKGPTMSIDALALEKIVHF